ncbi:hypothetical protein CYMTET_6034, partial [Cymbomonas tetramitiformis]
TSPVKVGTGGAGTGPASRLLQPRSFQEMVNVVVDQQRQQQQSEVSPTRTPGSGPATRLLEQRNFTKEGTSLAEQMLQDRKVAQQTQLDLAQQLEDERLKLRALQSELDALAHRRQDAEHRSREEQYRREEADRSNVQLRHEIEQLRAQDLGVRQEKQDAERERANLAAHLTQLQAHAEQDLREKAALQNELAMAQSSPPRMVTVERPSSAPLDQIHQWIDERAELQECLRAAQLETAAAQVEAEENLLRLRQERSEFERERAALLREVEEERASRRKDQQLYEGAMEKELVAAEQANAARVSARQMRAAMQEMEIGASSKNEEDDAWREKVNRELMDMKAQIQSERNATTAARAQVTLLNQRLMEADGQMRDVLGSRSCSMDGALAEERDALAREKTKLQERCGALERELGGQQNEQGLMLARVSLDHKSERNASMDAHQAALVAQASQASRRRHVEADKYEDDKLRLKQEEAIKHEAARMMAEAQSGALQYQLDEKNMTIAALKGELTAFKKQQSHEAIQQLRRGW